MLLLTCWIVTAQGQRADAEQERLRAQGQRLYREGLRADGSPVQAQGAAQTRLTGKEAACMTCHRRSGFGSSEGQFTIRPITGPALLQEDVVGARSPNVRARVGVRVRPPYTEETLANALRVGTDAAGKPLHRAMPRYELSDTEVRALAAYLFNLSAQASPGVDAQEIHFATVITPDIAEGKRKAMLNVMNAFVRDKDSNTRHEELRRSAGNMRMARAWRKWVLHVWELSGPRETWRAQLEARYSEQPVFAMIGGLGGSDWAPVQAFSEDWEIPTVLPLVDVLPQADSHPYYTFYFSRGVRLEADVLAWFLLDQAQSARIVQVYRAEDAGSEAAVALRSALGERGKSTVQDVVLSGAADDVFWRNVACHEPDAVVLWLGGGDLTQAGALDARLQVYLSFQLAEDQVPEALRQRGNVRMVYPSDTAPRHDTRLLRTRHWLQSKGLFGMGPESVQSNTLFALSVVGEVVGHMADNYSRDYFVERVEHMVGQTPMPSVYPQLSLGPGQRLAAKGAQLVEFESTGKGLRPVSAWIIP